MPACGSTSFGKNPSTSFAAGWEKWNRFGLPSCLLFAIMWSVRENDDACLRRSDGEGPCPRTPGCGMRYFYDRDRSLVGTRAEVSLCGKTARHGAIRAATRRAVDGG